MSCPSAYLNLNCHTILLYTWVSSSLSKVEKESLNYVMRLDSSLWCTTVWARELISFNFNSFLRLNEASFMYKNLYVSADSNVIKINFHLRNKVSQRITRNGSDVHIDYWRTAVWQKAVSVSGAKLWNSISINIRNSNIIVTFKSHMYKHLLEHQ